MLIGFLYFFIYKTGFSFPKNLKDLESRLILLDGSRSFEFLQEDIEVFDFFSARSIFISPNEQQKQNFHEWRSHE